jgi:hypothetical protein
MAYTRRAGLLTCNGELMGLNAKSSLAHCQGANDLKTISTIRTYANDTF